MEHIKESIKRNMEDIKKNMLLCEAGLGFIFKGIAKQEEKEILKNKSIHN